ncbi:MAG TPA: YciI family protein [Gemmatimonadales bacterium]|nr:YciI family protein [Gemmatimonadales bacterium]
MQYLCLIYSDETMWPKMSRQDAESMMSEYMAFTAKTKESGHYLGGNRLQPTHTATSVRIRNGSLSATDGPFAETKEQLGGYYLIEAKDLNDAIQVASRIPGARVGTIEVRPIAPVPPR